MKYKHSAGWKSKKVKRYCLICNKEFDVMPAYIKRGDGKFCSSKCFGIWTSQNQRGENNPSWKGGKIKRICQMCNKVFFVFPAEVKYGRGKFCSRKCQGKWQSKNYRGKNHSAWKGGITPITRLIRESNKYKQWRQNVFIRDDFTCQKCGQIGGNLEAHHKKPFHKLIEEVKKYLPLLDLYEGAMVYTPLWDIDNGITLCEECHKKIDTRR